MSVEINWDVLTSGSDGARLAESIRKFIHDRFQQVPLPRFIRSVEVHSFHFGDRPPEILVKDICEPLPDFYEEDEHDSSSEDRPESEETTSAPGLPRPHADHHLHNTGSSNTPNAVPAAHHLPSAHDNTRPPRPPINAHESPLSPLFFGSHNPGIPGGTHNMSYFHIPYGAGLSGSNTPLVAMAGAHFESAWPDNQASTTHTRRKPSHQHSASISSVTPPSSSDPASRPPSQHRQSSVDESEANMASAYAQSDTPSRTAPERGPNDLQVVAHVKYSGNMSLELTAEILLDYPMPSFVGIPLKLHITGFSFDGVAIVAYIKRKVHSCFLSPEDAHTYIGTESMHEDASASHIMRPLGGLLEEVQVESEIGQKENGRQVLKNVGKVEKFVLEQVRRIFEDEFVFPSFWTFLV